MKVLLRAGASLETRDNRGVTPLIYACHIGRTGIVSTLLAKGADAHSAEIVRLLIAAGAEIDRRAVTTGATPLMCASRAGRDGPVMALLKAGADPLVKGNHRIYQVSSQTQ